MDGYLTFMSEYVNP